MISRSLLAWLLLWESIALPQTVIRRYPVAAVVGGGSISFIKKTNGTNNTSSTTVATSNFGSSVTSGSGRYILVYVEWEQSGINLASCADTLGNTYSVVTAQGHDATNGQSAGLCYAPITTGGTNAVTATFSAAPGCCKGIVAAEYSGLAASSVLDGSGVCTVGTGSTATDGVTSGSQTTTVNGDLIFGGVADDTGGGETITHGTGFTERENFNALGQVVEVEDFVQATAGAIAATWTFSTSQRSIACAAAFKAGP